MTPVDLIILSVINLIGITAIYLFVRRYRFRIKGAKLPLKYDIFNFILFVSTYMFIFFSSQYFEITKKSSLVFLPFAAGALLICIYIISRILNAYLPEMKNYFGVQASEFVYQISILLSLYLGVFIGLASPEKLKIISSMSLITLVVLIFVLMFMKRRANFR